MNRQRDAWSARRGPTLSEVVSPVPPAALKEQNRRKRREAQRRKRAATNGKTHPFDINDNLLQSVHRELSKAFSRLEMESHDLIHTALKSYREDLKFKRQLAAKLSADLGQ